MAERPGRIFIEGTIRGTQGLPERVIVIRQQFNNPEFLAARTEPADGELSAGLCFPMRLRPIINVTYGQPEFWRVVNATTQAFLTLAAAVRKHAAATGSSCAGRHSVTDADLREHHRSCRRQDGRNSLFPAFPGADGVFLTNGFDTGPVGNPNPPQQLMKLFGTDDGKPSRIRLRLRQAACRPSALCRTAARSPTTTRKLYFSEQTVGSNGPTQYFITVNGQKPQVFHMDDPPAIVTNIGAVEDWTIENHSGEAHAFHIHQLHFLLMAINGVPVPNPELMTRLRFPTGQAAALIPASRCAWISAIPILRERSSITATFSTMRTAA